MAKNKWYAVKVGKTPGIYETWEECKAQVDGVSGAVFKSFSTLAQAKEFLEEPQVDDCPSVEPETAVAYVDGSYNVATGEYSCGIVFITEKEEIHLAQKGENEELATMRNVAGEILGAELAMRKAVEMGLHKLSIYHDYQGIASWCLGEWKTNKEGTRAYKQYYDSIQGELDISFVKVKGHSGNPYNDLADELAKSVIFS